jgi:hypothetical protein
MTYGGSMMKIKEITLHANSLDGIRNFYIDILELSVLEENNHKISIIGGTSILSFILSKESEAPYYHFAMNITENKRDQALHWLKNKGVEINQIDGQDDYYSVSWNSHSIYFYDPLGNIVEFIARHNIVEDDQGNFISEDIKNISEIGFPVEEVPNVSAFAPLGDEEGLFILSGLNRNWLGSNKAVKVFPLAVEIYSNVDCNENLLNYPYTKKEVLIEANGT